jgi:hypothetical protein
MESFIFQMAILQRMSYSREKVAGVIFFIAVTQFTLLNYLRGVVSWLQRV